MSGPTDGGSPTACSGTTAVDVHCIVDDMTMEPSQSGGYWYTFSDRTVPFGTDLIPGAAGTVVPPEDTGAYSPFPGTMMPGGPIIPDYPGGGPAPFREFAGGGLTLWGAGAGLDFTDQVPPGADGGPDGGPALGIPIGFDGSMHAGIAFWGKNNLATPVNQPVGIHVADAREARGGGVCDAGVPYATFDSGADIINDPAECGVDFTVTRNFTGTWQPFHVTWAQFGKNQNYAGKPYPSVDPTKLFYLHFQINNPGYQGAARGPTAPDASFDISIAYITWYDGA